MQAQFKHHTLFFQKKIRRVLLWFVVVLFLVGVLFLTQFLMRYKLTPRILWQVLWGKTTSVVQSNYRTNIVLLGIGGATHEGGSLTDTIIVVSVGLVTHDVVLISLPRDIWIPSLKDRINSAYLYGEEKSPGSGLVLAKSAVEEVVGIPIHYSILIDFEGFKHMIDAVDGIDVVIADTFTDPLYPIAGRETDECGGDLTFACRYETVTFTKGIEHMSGERALKYTRSRHAEGDAGTDFARGARQQAVLVGLKNKLTQKEILSNVEKMKAFITTTQQTITTDMPVTDTLLIGRSFIGTSPIVRTGILTQDEPEKNKIGLLINPPLWQYDDKWVLIPKHTDFKQIGKYIACVIENQSNCEEFMK